MRSPSLKDSLRHDIMLARSTVDDAAWSAEDEARTRHLLQALGHTPGTVALYASRQGEPGTTTAITVLHAQGWQVLLPLVSGAPGWARFDGWDAMRTGWAGIPEPAPRLGVEGLAMADVVVVACLGVARNGTRLGTGGGWYDRALLQRRPGVPVWSLARTQERFDALPMEPHDVPVDAVITPVGIHACGVTALPHIG
ncbi:5-formyltetrahydrofolate cyclo-ligase [Tessaracoccus sp.]